MNKNKAHLTARRRNWRIANILKKRRQIKKAGIELHKRKAKNDYMQEMLLERLGNKIPSIAGGISRLPEQAGKQKKAETGTAGSHSNKGQPSKKDREKARIIAEKIKAKLAGKTIKPKPLKKKGVPAKDAADSQSNEKKT